MAQQICTAQQIIAQHHTIFAQFFVSINKRYVVRRHAAMQELRATRLGGLARSGADPSPNGARRSRSSGRVWFKVKVG
jgi:hypothetical protein